MYLFEAVVLEDKGQMEPELVTLYVTAESYEEAVSKVTFCAKSKEKALRSITKIAEQSEPFNVYRQLK